MAASATLWHNRQPNKKLKRFDQRHSEYRSGAANSQRINTDREPCQSGRENFSLPAALPVHRFSGVFPLVFSTHATPTEVRPGQRKKSFFYVCIHHIESVHIQFRFSPVRPRPLPRPPREMPGGEGRRLPAC